MAARAAKLVEEREGRPVRVPKPPPSMPDEPLAKPVDEPAT
jgi:hypothetical protein